MRGKIVSLPSMAIEICNSVKLDENGNDQHAYGTQVGEKPEQNNGRLVLTIVT